MPISTARIGLNLQQQLLLLQVTTSPA